MDMKKLFFVSFMTLFCVMAYSQSFTINTDGEFICNDKNYRVIDYKGEKCADLYKKYTKGSKAFKIKYKDAGVELGINELIYYIDIKVVPSGLKREYRFDIIIDTDFKDEKIRIAPKIHRIAFNGGLELSERKYNIDHFLNKKGEFKSGRKEEVLDPVCNALNYVINDIISMANQVTIDDDW